VAAVDKISTYAERRAVPLRQMSLLCQQVQEAGLREATDSETRLLSDAFRSSATRKHWSDNSAFPPHARRARRQWQIWAASAYKMSSFYPVCTAAL